MTSCERANERWKQQELWHYEPCTEALHGGFGFWVTKPHSWRFWVLAPSAAYWLAANLNEHMVGEEYTHDLNSDKSASEV